MRKQKVGYKSTFIYLLKKTINMKWKTQKGKIMEISDMDDNHAKNCINMFIRNSSPQIILELICEANEARRKYNNKLRDRRRFTGLNGDMAQHFNETYPRDEEDYLERQYDEYCGL